MIRTLNIINRFKLALLALRVILFSSKPINQQTNYDIDIKDQKISIKLTFIDNSFETPLNLETVKNLHDYLTLGAIQSKSEATEERIHELADEVDSGVWKTLKSKYIKE